jgi:hypothetical protein
VLHAGGSSKLVSILQNLRLPREPRRHVDQAPAYKANHRKEIMKLAKLGAACDAVDNDDWSDTTYKVLGREINLASRLKLGTPTLPFHLPHIVRYNEKRHRP